MVFRLRNDVPNDTTEDATTTMSKIFHPARRCQMLRNAKQSKWRHHEDTVEHKRTKPMSKGVHHEIYCEEKRESCMDLRDSSEMSFRMQTETDRKSPILMQSFTVE
jgi:hypothetical protein